MNTKLPKYKVRDIYTGEVFDKFSDDNDLDVERAIEDLKEALVPALRSKVDYLQKDVNKWKSKYLNQISSPCAHEHLSLSKDDKGTHMVCSCCLKVMETKASAEAFIVNGG